MTPTEIVDLLAAHRTVGKASREELGWLAAHGTIRRLEPGEVLTSKDGRAEYLFVILSGHITISVERGTGAKKVMEWRDGDVTGLLPYSRMVSPPADTVAELPSLILAVHRDDFLEMIGACHEVTAALVHTMVDRARVFTSSGLLDEKMVSLGKLAAGLAHELNNPASAIERSAALLKGRLDDAERAARVLGASRLGDDQLAAVDAVRGACTSAREPGVRSPIERAEREEAVAAWLRARGVDAAPAEDLADTTLSFEALDRLAGAVEGKALEAALSAAAASCTLRSLASDIQAAAARISGLVQAIKGFTHMDQAALACPVDLVAGLESTVAVLRSKARTRRAAVVLDVAPGLPRVRGFAGELNQVWANLIDNALDAIPDGGRVEVRARREEAAVVVSVIDDGPGIPEAVRTRVFDPFFTTKPVGQGTGLGLDIVRRLVRHNDGAIGFESVPGRTAFRVSLPVAEPASGGERP